MIKKFIFITFSALEPELYSSSNDTSGSYILLFGSSVSRKPKVGYVFNRLTFIISSRVSCISKYVAFGAEACLCRRGDWEEEEAAPAPAPTVVRLTRWQKLKSHAQMHKSQTCAKSGCIKARITLRLLLSSKINNAQ